LLTVAVAGMIVALQALTENVHPARIDVALRLQADQVVVEVSEDGVRVPSSWRAKFLDPAWSDRPGGPRAAVSLAASRRVADLHRGTLAVEDAGNDTVRLVLSVPRA
jgi:sensor histidine kinase regulating citrate/malate metabolism